METGLNRVFTAPAFLDVALKLFYFCLLNIGYFRGRALRPRYFWVEPPQATPRHAPDTKILERNMEGSSNPCWKGSVEEDRVTE